MNVVFGMIYGQEFAYHRVQSIISDFKSDKISIPFVLLVGPEHIGKWSILQDIVYGTSHKFPAQDICTLYDMSNTDLYAHKTHQIKISTLDAGKIPTLTRPDGSVIYDYGIRELQNWLAISALAGYKIVLIENIDRLTSSAANAMLKILEEPLAQRLIIATTTSLTTILPTIVSRAQCINCSLASQEDISQYLHQCYHHLADEIHHRIITMCGSAIGIADTLAQQSAEEINHYYQHCEIVLQGSLLDIYQILQGYLQAGTLSLYLSLLQSYMAYHHHYHQISLLIHYKQYSKASVGADTMLLDLAYHISQAYKDGQT